MPKVVSYTPPWLCRPSPGSRIFSNPEPQSPVSPSKRSSYFNNVSAAPTKTDGPRRLVASRGSEIFTVVGNKIRWADLNYVKETWEQRSHEKGQDNSPEIYRTLATPVYYQITQLIISPSGLFLAICTEHTVHVAVLPESSRLGEKDLSPLKLKTYQVGPTTHVIPESPLVSTLWHPLAASSGSTDCLVTVTAEAAVRVWELDRTNQWSFERPALAIDLRKLADGVSSDQDFEPHKFGKNRGFSADAFDMEVSAACFGGSGSPDEDGWASMTLWTAMSNGDVYALCPLLPAKWRPSLSTIPSLSISAVSKVSSLDGSSDNDERMAVEQQYEWVQQVDNENLDQDDSAHESVRQRPQNPSAIPRLQGPFELAVVDLDDSEIADIFVIGARLDEDLLLSGEDDFDAVSDGLQFTTICLSTTSNTIFVAIELEGVSGQWLPKRGRSTFSVPTSHASELLLLEEIDIADSGESNRSTWPTFISDGTDAYSFYVTTANRIHTLSLTDWAARVGIEVSGKEAIDSGIHTRLAVACQGRICHLQEVFKNETVLSSGLSVLSTPSLVDDPLLGRMLISCGSGEACAVIFDQSTLSQSVISSSNERVISPFRSSIALNRALQDELPDPVPTRAPYAPSKTFYLNQTAPLNEMRSRLSTSRRSILTEKPLRLSPACLDVLTLAHRTFSHQTSYVEQAAAELFRRCERLREELANQVKQMGELADRLQHIKPDASHAAGGEISSSTSFNDRLSATQERQRRLTERYEVLRRKAGRTGPFNRTLSAKEKIWCEEISMLAKKVGISNDEAATDTSDPDSVITRYDTVRNLASSLTAQSAQAIQQASSSPSSSPQKDHNSSTAARSMYASVNNLTSSPGASVLISSKLQRERITEVMAMVEREGAIIDAVVNRLSKLSAA